MGRDMRRTSMAVEEDVLRARQVLGDDVSARVALRAGLQWRQPGRARRHSSRHVLLQPLRL